VDILTTTTPFYQKALRLFTKTQEAQIKKGLVKYPTAFNPSDWTPDELLNHALEESVDLVHYLVGLKELIDAKDKEVEKYKARCLDYERKINSLVPVDEKGRFVPSIREHDMNYDYIYKPVSGDPLSPYGPFITKVPKYFDPDDQ
jgi:hypothetical protein